MKAQGNPPEPGDSGAADGVHRCGRLRNWTWLGPIVFGFLAFAVAVVILLPTQDPERRSPSPCLMNLRGLGQAIYIYAQDAPDMAFPDDFQKVFDAKLALPKQLICPNAARGHACYYYIPGCSAESDPTTVVMFEDPRNHAGEGGHVLDQSGFVSWVKFPEYQAILEKYKDRAKPAIAKSE